MKRSRVGWLVAGGLLAACAGEDAAEPSMQTGTVEQALITCGPFCPPGYTSVGFACGTACPGTCPNAVSCVPIPQGATLTATPSSVPVQPGKLGTSRICWNTSGLHSPVWIKVSAHGAPEQLFTKESDSGRACENAPWIQAGSSYVFSIRTQKTGGSVLASVTVVGVPTP
ncbi:hypothetical protein JGU66_32265 [Myxococcaceae bacterium JPH2]|nr:hypothetical protein [Myxococcaceae bacterium JPH2]